MTTFGIIMGCDKGWVPESTSVSSLPELQQANCYYYENYVSISLSFLCQSHKKIPANNNWIIRLLQFFESGDEILWCYHSNETSFANRLHGRIYFMISRHET